MLNNCPFYMFILYRIIIFTKDCSYFRESTFEFFYLRKTHLKFLRIKFLA